MFKLFKTISQAAFTSGQRQSLFTGSVSIEKKELAAAATKLKRVSLELGVCSRVYVQEGVYGRFVAAYRGAMEALAKVFGDVDDPNTNLVRF
ncbi:hypothetical protein LB505_012633 [Fusarium chuoi]|nr:hypothetical protein LB505_012633 [Fusarium chuoi]